LHDEIIIIKKIIIILIQPKFARCSKCANARQRQTEITLWLKDISVISLYVRNMNARFAIRNDIK